jgi:hypothetical protein
VSAHFPRSFQLNNSTHKLQIHTYRSVVHTHTDDCRLFLKVSSSFWCLCLRTIRRWRISTMIHLLDTIHRDFYLGRRFGDTTLCPQGRTTLFEPVSRASRYIRMVSGRGIVSIKIIVLGCHRNVLKCLIKDIE